MNGDNKTYIIAYDVSDNKKRARIVKLLSDYGIRIQKSVFYCILSRYQMDCLMSKLRYTSKQFRDDGSDSVIFFEDIKRENIKIVQGKESRILEELSCRIL